MLKKIPLAASLLVIVVVLISAGGYLTNGNEQDVLPNTQTTSTPIANPYLDTFEGFRLSWVEVKNTKDIHLFSNLSDKKTSLQVFEQGNCQYVVSAGFYNKQNNHIGLFVSGGETISESITDDFFDGYFYIKNGIASISLTKPTEADVAVQSGPVIMQNNKFLIKTYPNDDYSRRMLVGINRKGSVIFITIYGDNKITGPKLGDIKKIITKLEEKSSVDLVELINLDGGSHSAFITDSVRLSEISSIGGYFCVSK